MSLLTAFKNWRIKSKIPKLAVLTEGDNEILLNLDNLLCIKTLFSEIKNSSVFTLREFVFNPEKAIVQNADGSFLNQFVFAFHKEKEGLKNV